MDKLKRGAELLQSGAIAVTVLGRASTVSSARWLTLTLTLTLTSWQMTRV